MTIAVEEPRPAAFASENHLGQHAAWYVVAGVVTTGIQAGLFLALQPNLGSQAANLLAIALTTLGNTEFHRRVTFADRPSNATKRHVQDLITFCFYAGYGSLVLALLEALVSEPNELLETAVLVAASVTGGIARFAVLRWWVFAAR